MTGVEIATYVGAVAAVVAAVTGPWAIREGRRVARRQEEQERDASTRSDEVQARLLDVSEHVASMEASDRAVPWVNPNIIDLQGWPWLRLLTPTAGVPVPVSDDGRRL